MSYSLPPMEATTGRMSAILRVGLQTAEGITYAQACEQAKPVLQQVISQSHTGKATGAKTVNVEYSVPPSDEEYTPSLVMNVSFNMDRWNAALGPGQRVKDALVHLCGIIESAVNESEAAPGIRAAEVVVELVLD